MDKDNLKISLKGHVKIMDKSTGEVLVDKDNAIHYGNMANLVARALNNNSDAHIHYMAFGNGATSVDTSGKIVYKTPRVTESYNAGADLYSRTYHKQISAGNSDEENNKIEVINGVSYTDIKITCTLGYTEPSGQAVFDNATSLDDDFTFDEMALFSYPLDPTAATPEEQINTSTMLTHVIFHPQQKSSNRELEIIYTVRIQLS